jgi:hypothetical protein
MKYFYLLPLLALGSPAFAQDQGGQGQPQGQTIVITALSQSARALRDCLARHCSPEEDIAASLAHAENQFVAGDYEGARRTLKASQRRNDRFASRIPVPVSGLYRAGARVAAHLGEGEDLEQSTWGIKRALKAGLPNEDARLVAADLEVAGMQASLGRGPRARRIFEESISGAEKIGRPDLAAMGRLRLAWLNKMDGDHGLARRQLNALAADRSPAGQAARLSALVLLARLDRAEGRPDSSDALIAEWRAAGVTRPILLFAPEIKMTTREGSEAVSSHELPTVSVTRLMATQNFDDRWVDVGFWVTPDGHVGDIDILRSKGPTYWTKPLLTSIKGRVYAPLTVTSPDGVYRVERYSFTSLWEDRTGTHLRQRGANARVEYLDLTAVQPQARSN